MRYIQTVTGPVPETEWGKTLMHEHCLALSTDTYQELTGVDEELKTFLKSDLCAETRGRALFYMHKHKDNQEQRNAEETIAELKYYKAAGGYAIVDVTPPGIGRDAAVIKQISEESGVKIVASTGLYIEETHPANTRGMSIPELTDLFLKDLNSGMDGTDIRAGYIGEIGMSDDWTQREVEVLKAAGAASAQSGVAMTVHQPIFQTYGDLIVDILLAEGVDPDNIILSHCDPTLIDVNYHCGLLERGVRLQFDEFQLEFPVTYGPYVKRWLPRDIDRIRHIKYLCDCGFEDRITVSMDMGLFKPIYRTYGGPGYAYLVDHLYPFFLYEGVTEEQMEKILVRNPISILAR